MGRFGRSATSEIQYFVPRRLSPNTSHYFVSRSVSPSTSLYFVSRSVSPSTPLFCLAECITEYTTILFRGEYHRIHPLFCSEASITEYVPVLSRGEYRLPTSYITRSCWELTPSSASRSLAHQLLALRVYTVFLPYADAYVVHVVNYS